MSQLRSLPKYPKIDISEKEKILEFIKKHEINFIQPVFDRNVIYLIKTIGRTSYREAKVVSKEKITYEKYEEIENLKNVGSL